MGFLKNLKMQFKPPRLNDPDFGELIYMYISNNPGRSYWECMWNFPPTKTKIAIALDGDEAGPNQGVREWHLNLVSKYYEILELCRPVLKSTLQKWSSEDLNDDVFKMVKLTGFGLENPTTKPINWDVSFETTGKQWLSITIPFVGQTAQEATVDT